MMKRKLSILLALTLCLSLLCGCGDMVIGQAPASSAPQGGASQTVQSGGVTTISLTGSGASIDGGGAAVDGSTVKINAPGEYLLRGTLDAGQLIVNTGEVKGDVTLVLSSAEIRCPDGPAILVEQVKNCCIELADGSFNRLVSGTEGTLVAEKLEGAVIFSEDDLKIRGTGALEIQGWLNNGVTCKDDLDIEGGTISLRAVNNGLKGSESVEISGGELTILAGNDGVKSSSAKKEGKGFVAISGGKLDITAGGDGVSAESELDLNGGEVKVTTRGDTETTSSKGLKARTKLTVSGGTLSVESTDHALHCTADLLVSGGTLTLKSSAGKGISAHGELTVSGGMVGIESANDGLSSEVAVNLTGGGVDIFSGQDGVKAKNRYGTAGSFSLSGGSLRVSALGDIFDVKSEAVITGGSILGFGNAKSPVGFSAASSQPFLLFRLAGAEGAENELVYDEGEGLVEVLRARCGFTYVIYSTSELIPGSYHLKCGTLSAAAKIA